MVFPKGMDLIIAIVTLLFLDLLAFMPRDSPGALPKPNIMSLGCTLSIGSGILASLTRVLLLPGIFAYYTLLTNSLQDTLKLSDPEGSFGSKR